MDGEGDLYICVIHMNFEDMLQLVILSVAVALMIQTVSAFKYSFIPDSNIFMDIVQEYTATDPLNASNGTFASGVTVNGKSVLVSSNITDGSMTNMHNHSCRNITGTATDLCAITPGGGSSGPGVWMATGAQMTPNASAGGQQNVNVTGNYSGAVFISTGDQFCNGTAITPDTCYTVAQLALDTDRDTDTNCSAAGYCANVLYTANTTGWDLNQTDDFVVNGSKNMTGNVTLQNNITYAIGNPNSWLWNLWSRAISATYGYFTELYAGGLIVLNSSSAFGGDVSGTYTAIKVITTQGITEGNITGNFSGSRLDDNISCTLTNGGTDTDFCADYTQPNSSISLYMNNTGFPSTSLTGAVGTPNSSISLYVNNTGVPANSITGFSSRVNTSGVPADSVTGFSTKVNNSGVPTTSLTGTLTDAQVPNNITLGISGTNITTTESIILDADNRGLYDGADQDFRQYWNGTCELFVLVATGSTLAICP